jgi:ribosome-associated protein
MLEVNRRIQIPLEEFQFTFVRSSGPGGQNVNKVNSKAVLRWAVTASPSLPDDVRQRFLTQYPTRITTEGELVLSSQKYRDQPRNQEDCLEKVREMLLAVAAAPTVRRATKPSRGAKLRRLEGKRARSAVKSNRRSRHGDD